MKEKRQVYVLIQEIQVVSADAMNGTIMATERKLEDKFIFTKSWVSDDPVSDQLLEFAPNCSGGIGSTAFAEVTSVVVEIKLRAEWQPQERR